VPLQSFRQLTPLFHFQNDTAVRDGNTVPFHRVVMRGNATLLPQLRIEMTDKLMSVQIEVYPLGITTTFRATQHFLVELPGLGNISDLYGYVKRRQVHMTMVNPPPTISYQPPFLAVWGKNDPAFIPPGAEAFRRDLPEAEIHFLDTGHFALETHASEIGAYIREFLGRKLLTAERR
jgi:pimeloyl-ACP methyl ester carboxylesterase